MVEHVRTMFFSYSFLPLGTSTIPHPFVTKFLRVQELSKRSQDIALRDAQTEAQKLSHSARREQREQREQREDDEIRMRFELDHF